MEEQYMENGIMGGTRLLWVGLIYYDGLIYHSLD